MRRHFRYPSCCWLPLVVCTLFWVNSVFSADLMISEFMASNRVTIEDSDGDSSDWIEIYNAGQETVDLAGWYLTDDPNELDKWTFPEVSLNAGGYLLVFASGKDRRLPGEELHANFRLNADGDYLGLVRPDGVTVVHDFGLLFPEQLLDYSFGIGQAVTVDSMIASDADVLFLVPPGETPGSDWRDPDDTINPLFWETGQNGLGYVNTVDGFMVRNFKANTSVSHLSVAEQVISNQGMQLEVHAANDPFIDYLGTGGQGHYDNQLPFPGAIVGVDEDHFVIEAIGTVTIPSTGPWTFGVYSDDGFSLELSNGDASFYIEHPNPRGPADTLGVFQVTTPGAYELRLVMYEAGGGSCCEMFAAPGSHGSWNGNFKLIGDVTGGGLDVQSEPSGATGAVSSFSSLINTDIKDMMFGFNSTVYVRIPFTTAQPSAYETLFLRARYDDGFVAYLNGEEVARRNAPDRLSYLSWATANRPASLSRRYDDINISHALPLLRSGDNLLAIHALNDAPDSSDFIISAELADITVVNGVENYFDAPTPGYANATGFLDVVRDTRFSVDRGFFVDPIEVAITTETPDAEIRYTLDGTMPTQVNGLVYTGPISILYTTVLRAAAFKPDHIPTNVDTQTYLFLDDVIRQDSQAFLAAGFPASWGSVTADYGFDGKVVGPSGTDLYGGKYADTIKQDLAAIPTLSIVAKVDDFFGASGIYTNSTSRGVSWERPASVELIHPDGTVGFQEDAGIRIQGGYFRNHGPTRKHSFRLLFKAQYGSTKLRYPMFGPEAADRFDCITLRANANDAWRGNNNRALYIRDSWGRRTSLDMGQNASREIFVHLYINGFYWGLYNPVERPDASFSATYYGGDKDTWDVLNHGGISDGNYLAWNTLVDMANVGLANDADYYLIQGKDANGLDDPDLPDYLDVENYIDYMIVNLYMGNTDWPHNNFWHARDRAEGSTGFKFYMWDAEFGLALVSNLNTNHLYIDRRVAAPWMPLWDNAKFRRLIGDRLQRHFFNGGALAVDPTNPQWDPEHPERNRPAERFMKLANQIDRAIVAESARWGDQGGTPLTRDEHWAVERDRLLRDYFPMRSSVVLQQFRDAGLFPHVDAPVFHQHGGAVEAGFSLLINPADGIVYYTVDGTDPCLPDGSLNGNAVEGGTADNVVFVDADSPVRVFVPTDGSLGLSWIQPDFDDQQWQAGTLGVGYEVGSGYAHLINTDIQGSLYNQGTSVYIRVPFYLEDASGFSFLSMGIRYDDGFVAYLNGTRITARNGMASPQWNSAAAISHSDTAAVQYEHIDLAQHAGELRAGWNVLAIHGMNVSAGSSDMLISPRMEGTRLSDANGTVITETTMVKARAWKDGQWSALNEATFYVFGPLNDIRVTEIMYHPADDEEIDGDLFEFIELKNVGDETIDLSGTAFHQGIYLTLPEGASLRPGELGVLVSNLSAFQERYPIAGKVLGVYSGNLSNAGETVSMEDGHGGTFLSVTFDDAEPWPVDADGWGYSLVPVDPSGEGDPSSHAYWRLSVIPGGTPGYDDTGEVPGGLQLHGDLNQDGKLDLSDAINILMFLFDTLPMAMPCEGDIRDGGGNLTLVDVNLSGTVDLADAVYLLTYQFVDGPPPALGEDCVRILGCPDSC